MYYFDLNGKSWKGAEEALYYAGYYAKGSPWRLQRTLQMWYKHAISRIEIEGTEVVPVALYEALDGKDSRDYHYRVEPSSRGGHKIANLLLKKAGLS